MRVLSLLIARRLALSIICLVVMIGLCGCHSTNSKSADRLSKSVAISLSDNNEFETHPFLTADGNYAVVLPAHWNLENLVAHSSTNEDSKVGDNLLSKEWTPLHIELEKAYVLSDNQQITFYQTARKSLFINTESGSMAQIDASTDKSYGESGLSVIYSHEGEELFRDEFKEIAGRGNSSWLVDKKPYKLVYKKKQSILDLAKDKEFCLLSLNAVNHYICYNIAEEAGNAFPIQGNLTNVYLNGHYNGLYYLCNRVKVSKRIIDIPDMEDINESLNPEAFKDPVLAVLKNADGEVIAKGIKNFTDPEDITGGYVIERFQYDNKYDKAQSAFIDTLGNYNLFKTQKRLSVRQVNYVRNLINQMLVAIMSEDGINHETGKHYSEYIHTESFARHYLTQELLCNYDAGKGSFFMVKNADSIESRLLAAPIWDMDWTLGRMSTFPLNEVPNALMVSAGYNTPRFSIFAHLMKHPEFAALADSIYYADMVPIIDKWFVNDGLKENIKHDARLEFMKYPEIGYASFDEMWDHMRQFEQEKAHTYDLIAQNRKEKTAANVVLNFGWWDNNLEMLQPLGENIQIPSLSYWRDDTINPHTSQGWFIGDEPINPADYKVESDVYVEQKWQQKEYTLWQKVRRKLGF